MTITRSLHTSRRAGRAATAAVGLLVAALLGLAEPAATTATLATATANPAPSPAAPGLTSDTPRKRDPRDDDERDSGKKDTKGERERGRTDESGTGESDDALAAVGQLLSKSGACSGTVISRQLVLTAAHCIFIPQRSVDNSLDLRGLKPGPVAKEYTFVPGRTGTKAPHGQWQVAEARVSPAWPKTGSASDDFAILRIAPKVTEDGETIHIQDVVGSRSVDVTAGKQAALTAVGYPAEGQFDGTTQQSCTDRRGIRLQDGIHSMRCDLNGGASGGPWFNKNGRIVSVTSSVNAGEDRNEITGPQLDDTLKKLIAAVNADDRNE
jgi:V8-like Glu-specific endopeptidase